MFGFGWLGWAFLSAFFAGLTAILAKIGVSNVNSNLATAIRTTVILVFSWAIVLFTGQTSAMKNLASRTLFFLVLSGIATGLSWLCYFRALQLGPASKVAPIDKLSVVFVMILSVLILGEKLSPATVLGGVLIVAGSLILALFT